VQVTFRTPDRHTTRTSDSGELPWEMVNIYSIIQSQNPSASDRPHSLPRHHQNTRLESSPERWLCTLLYKANNPVQVTSRTPYRDTTSRPSLVCSPEKWLLYNKCLSIRTTTLNFIINLTALTELIRAEDVWIWIHNRSWSGPVDWVPLH
jgi:hypothetical protein